MNVLFTEKQILARIGELARELSARFVPGARIDIIDPATSTDLDQAFHIEVTGSDVLLHYASADVAWFVDDPSKPQIGGS